MSQIVHAQAKAVQKPPTAASRTGVLQRQCACGQHALDGECEECRKKKGILQRASNGSVPNAVPPIVHEVHRSPKPLIDPATSAFMEPHFAHDFSQVPIHSKSRASIQAKLKVNTPGDIYEQEADRIADQVLATPTHHAVGSLPPRISPGNRTGRLGRRQPVWIGPSPVPAGRWSLRCSRIWSSASATTFPGCGCTRITTPRNRRSTSMRTHTPWVSTSFSAPVATRRARVTACG
jgi:hypothetical protein